jgi:hypothetical protein
MEYTNNTNNTTNKTNTDTSIIGRGGLFLHNIMYSDLLLRVQILSQIDFQRLLRDIMSGRRKNNIYNDIL